jgi:hypothetical protein
MFPLHVNSSLLIVDNNKIPPVSGIFLFLLVVIKAVWANATNACKGYTGSGASLNNPVVLTVNYHDSYEFMGLNGIPAANTKRFGATQIPPTNTKQPRPGDVSRRG